MLLNLEDFITAIMPDNKAQVCIVDLSGITDRDILQISSVRRIHSSAFCTRAKLLHGGLRLCMKCRNLAKDKALREKKPFYGTCSFGVSEVVYPVVSDGQVLCIISIGQLCTDMDALVAKTKKTASVLKQNADCLLEVLPCMQPCNDFDLYIQLAKAIESYILLLYNRTKSLSEEYSNYHEAVSATVNYILAKYYKEISIEHIANKYGINPKYLGRLFKTQTGESFNNYLNNIRIHHAAQLLAGTKAQIIEVALECGYNNVTYFNRVFKNLKGITPSEYRQQHRQY